MSKSPKPAPSDGTLYLVFTQVVSRGLTFVGNQLLLQYLSPNHLGLAVQLETLSTSVLYTSRESLRVALQRSAQPTQTKDVSIRKQYIQTAVNAAYLIIVLGLFLASIWGYWYLYQIGQEVHDSEDFKLSFWLYGIGTLFDLCSEPAFVVAQQYGQFNVRARAETIAAITRCVAACVTAVTMVKLNIKMSVLPYACGQFCYGLCLLIMYFASAVGTSRIEQFSVLPSRLPESVLSSYYVGLFSKPLLALAAAFYGQSVFKWLLTQGDVLVLSLSADLDAQGIFALASNYGGLASRLLFQPIEESSRNTFGRLLARVDGSSSDKSTETSQNASSLEALSRLTTILHGYILLIALPCITILPHLFPLLIRTLLGSRSRWASSETTALLSTYSYYIPLLAVNGILDAFVTSAATEAELASQSLLMVVITGFYLAAAYVTMNIFRLGAVGLVYANMFNMTLRIAYSLFFIRNWASRRRDRPGRGNIQAQAFSQFVAQSLPSTLCLVSGVVITAFLPYQMQSPIYSPHHESSKLAQQFAKITGGLSLREFSYLCTGGIVLLTSVLASRQERVFLQETIEPLIPRQVKRLFLSQGQRNA